MYKKLKEKHLQLVKDHADLLRKVQLLDCDCNNNFFSRKNLSNVTSWPSG